MRRISEKAGRFTESVIREMNRLAIMHGAVSLSQGFPDFACPQEIKDAAADAIQRDVNQYAITWGAKPLPRRDRGEDRALLPRLAARSRDPDHRHVRRDRGHDRGDARLSSIRATRSSSSSRSTRTTARTRS